MKEFDWNGWENRDFAVYMNNNKEGENFINEIWKHYNILDENKYEINNDTNFNNIYIIFSDCYPDKWDTREKWDNSVNWSDYMNNSNYDNKEENQQVGQEKTMLNTNKNKGLKNEISNENHILSKDEKDFLINSSVEYGVELNIKKILQKLLMNNIDIDDYKEYLNVIERLINIKEKFND